MQAVAPSAPSIDLGSWKQAFSRFGNNPEPRLPAASKALLDQAGQGDEGAPPVAVLDQLKLEWHRFLDHLSKKGMQVLVSHLHACELLSCSQKGLVEIGCCRKFSFEELLHDASLLEKELAGFYALPLKLHVRYDAERDACTKEKTVFTVFQELSETNEVVRFLISEFGGELIY
jgi:DNA polymerase-3 subunit gamma/tau